MINALYVITGVLSHNCLSVDRKEQESS